MRKILMSVAAAASLLALPALAQTAANQLSSDPEIRVQQEWEQLVAKTNAKRQAPQALGDVAAVKTGTATDAQRAPAYQAPQPAVTPSHYNTMQDYWQDR